MRRPTHFEAFPIIPRVLPSKKTVPFMQIPKAVLMFLLDCELSPSELRLLLYLLGRCKTERYVETKNSTLSTRARLGTSLFNVRASLKKKGWLDFERVKESYRVIYDLEKTHSRIGQEFDQALRDHLGDEDYAKVMQDLDIAFRASAKKWFSDRDFEVPSDDQMSCCLDAYRKTSDGYLYANDLDRFIGFAKEWVIMAHVAIQG
jgi:hypothetical protein